MFSRLFTFFVVALLAATSLSAEHAQDGTQPRKQGNTGKQAAQLKIIKSPMAPYPDEALKKNIEGKVTLSIVVDANGRVSDAHALSGPPELFQAALDSVKQWEFEPPSHAPVVTNAEVAYGHPKDCAAATSDIGAVESGGRLLDKNGKVVGAPDSDDYALPPYFDKDRKAGIAGEMVLSIALDNAGKVEHIHVVKSLSPHLDAAAVETVRTWEFKLINGNPGGPPNDFQVQIIYRAMCRPQF
jgi:TonB family protein